MTVSTCEAAKMCLGPTPSSGLGLSLGLRRSGGLDPTRKTEVRPGLSSLPCLHLPTGVHKQLNLDFGKITSPACARTTLNSQAPNKECLSRFSDGKIPTA